MKIIHIDPGLASQQFNQSCLEDVTEWSWHSLPFVLSESTND